MCHEIWTNADGGSGFLGWIGRSSRGSRLLPGPLGEPFEKSYQNVVERGIIATMQRRAIARHEFGGELYLQNLALHEMHTASHRLSTNRQTSPTGPPNE